MLLFTIVVHVVVVSVVAILVDIRSDSGSSCSRVTGPISGNKSLNPLSFFNAQVTLVDPSGLPIPKSIVFCMRWLKFLQVMAETAPQICQLQESGELKRWTPVAADEPIAVLTAIATTTYPSGHVCC